MRDAGQHRSSEGRYDYIKIDVEGAELLVLKVHAKQSRAIGPVILFEAARWGGKAWLEAWKTCLRSTVDELRYDVFLVKGFP